VVLYDPATCLYGLQYHTLTGDYFTLGGGVEDGDTPLSTVTKELIEETGFTDFEIVCQLGGQITVYMQKKTGNLERLATPYFVLLKNHNNIGQTLTAEETRLGAVVKWVSGAEGQEIFERQVAVEHIFEYHWEVFERGVSYVNENFKK
jgi:8-oxo-dGTP pyrophosphatase MutT (NUDIX family)